MTDAVSSSVVGWTAEAGFTDPHDWHRIFESLNEEHDYIVDEIEGKLPAGLSGTMWRNGPSKREQGGTPLNHLFDGDGMVSAITLDGKSVRYRNRFVRTPNYLRGLGTGGITDRGPGTLVPGGPEANAGIPMAEYPHTHVIVHAQRLLALYGGGRPWEMDIDSLQTLGTYDFGLLENDRSGFSAHPRVDPITGDLFNFTNQGGPNPVIHLYRIDKHGNGTRLHSTRVPTADFVHDFAITARHFVFALAPFSFDYQAIINGTASPLSVMNLRNDLPTTFVVMNRDGSDVRHIDHDTFGFYHFVNAYDDGDDVVIELDRFVESWDAINQSQFDFRTAPLISLAHRTVRYRIGASGSVAEDVLSPDHLSDFPQIDSRLNGLRHRHSYHTTVVPETGAGGIGKIDRQTSRYTIHQLPDGHITGEPSFVPFSPDAGEDEGWLLSVAYDPAQNRSRLLVLDARDVEADPIAVAHLRHHVPFMFHGSYTAL